MSSMRKAKVNSVVAVAAVLCAIVSAAYGDPAIVLTGTETLEDLCGAADSETIFQIEVPYGMAELLIRTDAGTGDCDLYASKDVPPTTSAFEHCDRADGNIGIIIVTRPSPGTWYIMLHGDTAYAGVRLWVRVNEVVAMALGNGIPVTGICGGSGSKTYYTIEVPEGQDCLEVNTWGGTGDIDLYVRHEGKPTRFSYDARSVVGGTDESVHIDCPACGKWYILLYGYSSYDDVSLRAQYGVSVPVCMLEDEVPITGLSGSSGSKKWFAIDVPSGRAGIAFRIHGGVGDCDMYIKRGAKPTETDWDYRPVDSGNDESVSIGSPAGGRWYVLLKADSAYSGVTLEADYWAPTIGDVTPLVSGCPVTGIAGSPGCERFFCIDVPIGVKKLEIKMCGGSGDADLYVRKGSLPTVGEYDFRPYLIGNDECVVIDNPCNGTWYVMIRGYQAFSGVTLVATCDGFVSDGAIPLKNGTAVPGLAGEAGSEAFFTIDVPEGQTRLEITTSGGTGDVDLYVRHGQKPTLNEWDYRPYLIGNNETVIIQNPKAGKHYILLRGYVAYAGVTLRACYVEAKQESHEG